MDDPLIELLLEHREVHKLVTTYGQDFHRKHVDPETGRPVKATAGGDTASAVGRRGSAISTSSGPRWRSGLDDIEGPP